MLSHRAACKGSCLPPVSLPGSISNLKHMVKHNQFQIEEECYLKTAPFYLKLQMFDLGLNEISFLREKKYATLKQL